MKRFVATLLLACWAWTLVLAGMPELHDWAHGVAHSECDEHGHSDPGDDEHDCAATLIATGALTVAHAAPLLTTEPMIFAEVVWPWRSGDVASLVWVGEPLERGPPESGV